MPILGHSYCDVFWIALCLDFFQIFCPHIMCVDVVGQNVPQQPGLKAKAPVKPPLK